MGDLNTTEKDKKVTVTFVFFPVCWMCKKARVAYVIIKI